MSKTKTAKPAKKAGWRNRIVGHAIVPASEILANPKNWRVHTDHQRAALEGVLDRVGWVQDVIVNQRTGLLIDGEMRVTSAAKRGEDVPVKYVDLDEEEEALMLAAIDPIGALALTDEKDLMSLLGEVEVANPALDQMFYALVDQTGQTTLRDEAKEEPEEDGNQTPKESPYILNNPAGAMIKPVLFAKEIGVFERALRATGIRHRGHAVVEVCRVNLEQQERNADRELEAIETIR